MLIVWPKFPVPGLACAMAGKGQNLCFHSCLFTYQVHATPWLCVTPLSVLNPHAPPPSPERLHGAGGFAPSALDGGRGVRRQQDLVSAHAAPGGAGCSLVCVVKRWDALTSGLGLCLLAPAGSAIPRPDLKADYWSLESLPNGSHPASRSGLPRGSVSPAAGAGCAEPLGELGPKSQL